MAELQPERRHFVGEAEIRRLRPHGADLVGGDARLISAIALSSHSRARL